MFDAALQLDWTRFRGELPLTLTLAMVGRRHRGKRGRRRNALCARLELDRRGALFGVLIAATDPVSVIASFREMSAEPRLAMVVESESLLNDGVAAVALRGALGHCGGRRVPVRRDARPGISLDARRRRIGRCGAALAILLIVGRTDDRWSRSPSRRSPPMPRS